MCVKWVCRRVRPWSPGGVVVRPGRTPGAGLRFHGAAPDRASLYERLGLVVCSLLLVGMVGCSDTAEDLEAYLFGPGGMEAALAEEARVIEQFNQQVNQNKDSEQRAQVVARLLRQQILPAYSSVLGRMNGLSVENKTVLELHRAYLAIAGQQKQVLEDLLRLLEGEDFSSPAEINTINLRLAKLRNRQSDWERELRRLCAKYEVTSPEP